MKRRGPIDQLQKAPGLHGSAGLLAALADLSSPDEVLAFLQDLCTPAELEAMADRWRVVPLLLAEVPYREIHDRTGVSVTTIGRVARCLAGGAGGYRLAASHMNLAATAAPARAADDSAASH